MKKIISTLLIVLCLFSLVACREDKKPMNTEPEKTSSLIGTWREIYDSDRESEWYEIVISENSIIIYYCSLPLYNPERKNIWEGSYPGDPIDPFIEHSFEAVAKEQNDFIRVFEYADEVLSVKKVSGLDYNLSTQPYIRCKKLETETN